MVFPISAKGKKALVQGIVEKLSFSKKQLIMRKKHQAKEHGTKFDPSSIKKGKTIYRIKGTGAIIND